MNNRQAIGCSSLITFAVLVLAWISGFASRLFAVIRFESIIHEFDPWYVVLHVFSLSVVWLIGDLDLDLHLHACETKHKRFT